MPKSTQNYTFASRVVVAVTGASGSIYALQLIQTLLSQSIRTYVLFTDTAKKVVTTECSNSFLSALADCKQRQRFESYEPLVAHGKKIGLTPKNLGFLKTFDVDDLYAPLASGSEGATHMVVCPSSMGSLARIAHGLSSNLVERTADVMLKERRTLIVVPRETPFNTIHLQNMLQLAQAGAHILPAMPAFYHNPKSIEECVGFVVERILDNLRLPELSNFKSVRWNYRQL